MSNDTPGKKGPPPLPPLRGPVPPLLKQQPSPQPPAASPSPFPPQQGLARKSIRDSLLEPDLVARQMSPPEPPAGCPSPPHSVPILQRFLSIFPPDQRNNVGIRGNELFLGTTKIGECSEGRFLIVHKLAKPAVKLPSLFISLLEEKGTVVFYEITASSTCVCAGKQLGQKMFSYPLG